MKILSVKNLSRSFGGIKANDNISFEVDEGTILGVIGPNGAGKSTLFDLITGYTKADDGQVEFFNKNIFGLSPDKISNLGVGRTFQKLKPFADQTLLENVMIGSFVKEKNIKKARDKALEVITSNEYSMFANWTDMWSKAGRNKTEHMWELQALGGSSFVNELHNYMSSFSTFGRGAMWFTNNHYNDYDTTDIRVLKGVVHNYEMNNAARTKYFYPSWQSYNYKVINGATYANNPATDDRAYTIKYSDVADPTVSRSDAHFPMIRYTEMYLIVAEADNEINNGPTPQAYTNLNTIRARAKTQTAPANLTRDEFRSFVLAERAREFVFEGVRRYDLMRWGIYLQVMNKIGIGQNNITKVRNTRNLLLPIPQSEINSNTLIPANNPGW